MTKSDALTFSTESACELVSDVVRKCGRVRLRVSGTSMVPTMRPGDTITVEKAAIREIAPGEIIVFSRSGRLVVHRVRALIPHSIHPVDERVRGHRLETRGDRMRRSDPVVEDSELLGRVTQIERRGLRIQPRAQLKSSEKAMCTLLRMSDRATGLYLRVSPR
jgi:signal peptidase I